MAAPYPQETFHQTAIEPSSFWGKRRDIVRSNTIQTQLDILKSTGRYDAFRLKWHPLYDDGYKALFWDSDVAKWLEGACYFLAEKGDQKDSEVIEAAVKELVGMIASAQCSDGYLNIHFTLVNPGHRFTNVRDLHELYNAGHLIEAALIHQQHFKNDDLLTPILKYVDLLHKTFGPGPDQIHGYPGHPEIELALLRLYHRTQEKKAYDLARYFITERGNPHGAQGEHYYVNEAKKRGDEPDDRPYGDAWPTSNAVWYQQAHKPILEQDTIEGHSVRAMYLLTSVADLVLHSRDVEKEPSSFEAYKSACERLWNNMVNKKMYLTGGIGAIQQWEGFGIDYFLPQSHDEGGCYAETCASIGVMMLAERMLQLDLDGKYSDIMELSLYNTVLGGMSQNGKEFLYENHLASCVERPSKRENWFEVSCCPPNLTRTFGMLGGYMWSHKASGSDVEIIVHLYNSATITFEVAGQTVSLAQETNWPWDNSVRFVLDAPQSLCVTIKLRLPGWAKPFDDGRRWNMTPAVSENLHVEKSYLILSPNYTLAQRKQTMTLLLSPGSFAPRFLTHHPHTNQDTLTVARGPIVYCAEDVDNSWVKDHFKSVRIAENAKLEEDTIHDSLLDEEIVVVKAPAVVTKEITLTSGNFPGFNASNAKETSEPVQVRFVPYFYRGNRGGNGQMRTGLKRL